MTKTQSQRSFLTVTVVMLATYMTPSFQRILGAKTWDLLGWTEARGALYLATRALLFIIFVLAAGIIGDFWGRRRILLLTLASLVACLVASMFIPFGTVVVALQAPLSILGTMIRALSVTIVILTATDKRERVRNLIYYSALAGGASILAPLMSAELLNSVDIKTLFVVPLILALVGFWMVMKYIPENRAPVGTIRNDAIALAIWTFGVCALIFSGILLSSLGWTHSLVLTGMAIGGGILLMLNLLSRISEDKPWKFTLYYQRQLSIVILAGVVLNLTLFAVLVQTYNFLYKVQEISAVTAAIGLAPILIGALVLGSLTNRLSVRFGLRDTLMIGLLVVAIPAFGLYILDPGLSYWAIMPFLILLGFGFILGNAPRLILLSTAVPINLSTTVQAIGSATAQLGGALAYSFVLTLLEGFAKNAYIKLLGNVGLSTEAIAEQVAKLASVSDTFPLVVPQEQQAQFFQGFDYILKKAYVTGISQAMLTLAGVCIFSAVVVRIGLQDKKSENGG